MHVEAMVGIAVVIAALGAMIGLVAWSRRAIEKIERKRLNSARDIVRELRNGG